MKEPRTAIISRKTSETDIALTLTLDGTGKAQVDTTLPFLDHMLNLLARHGLMDLSITGRGDTAVDGHHLVEDLGICLGQAVRQALGDKTGIERYGEATVPMDETLCRVALDLSGRPYLIYNCAFTDGRIGDFDPALLKEFFKAFSDQSGMTLHINLLYGDNNHHVAEAIFKALARALRKAVAYHEYRDILLSTKGTLV